MWSVWGLMGLCSVDDEEAWGGELGLNPGDPWEQHDHIRVDTSQATRPSAAGPSLVTPNIPAR